MHIKDWTGSLQSPAPTPCPFKLHCDNDWEENGTKCYKFFAEKKTWIDSKVHCRSQNGNLVKIDSREEQIFLFNKVKKLMKKADKIDDKFWIGLTDADKEGEWRWTDNSPLNQSLSFWFKHEGHIEPDNWRNGGSNPEGEDCVRMGETGPDFVEKCWFDQHCSNVQRFICEKEQTCL